MLSDEFCANMAVIPYMAMMVIDCVVAAHDLLGPSALRHYGDLCCVSMTSRLMLFT